MKNKKFIFLDLDSDDFTKNISSKEENDLNEIELAKKEAERIENDIKRRRLVEKNNIENTIKKDIEKLHSIENSTKKIKNDFEKKRNARLKLENELEKIEKLKEKAFYLKDSYVEKKENNKNYALQGNLNHLFSKNEKYEIKTNIYFKKEIYEEIILISKEYGISRTAVINKLLQEYLNKRKKSV
ncbi:MAG: hypothetical protein ACRDCG_00670 [Mycoplasmoidaceae bacterium]